MPAGATLKEWQIAVSAGVGFFGVILTLLFNAWLARRVEIRKRRHDRLALRTSFRSELGSLRDQSIGIIEEASRQLEKDDHSTVLAMKPRLATVICDKHIDKIGILTQKEIDAILEAYLFLTTVGDRILMLGHKVSLTQNPPEDWIEFHPNQTVARRIIKGNMEAFKEKAERAILAISVAKR
jgi:hypothetical protein